MTDEMTDYSQRQKDWRDISSNQLSLTNNILVTTSTGYFVLVFDREILSQITIDFAADIDWPRLFYIGSFILIFASIPYGLSVMFCRLYDFRISRHLALTRQRILKAHSERLPHTDVGSISWGDRVNQFLRVLFVRIDFISQADIDSYKDNRTNFKRRFNSLRRQAEILGRSTWKWTKIQVLLLVLSVVLYVASSTSVNYF
jgi:hypothetical protein